MQEALFAVWLALHVGAGNAEYPSLLEKLGSFYGVFHATEEELREAGASERLCRVLSDKDLTETYRVLRFCQENGVGILIYGDEHYPHALRALKDPPAVLYWRGELPDFSRRLSIAMVGKRSMSAYGMQTAYKIAYELAAAGAVVVSGMALGIDGVSACGAVTGGGRTVAILGSGIDVVYPRQHAGLMEAILAHGAVMTEFAPGTPPSGRHFPIRNRLISGLSQGTLVVEADEGSGAMITARHAIMQGRDVYAIPGNIGNRNAAGTNQLIRDGAEVVLCARDILDNYVFMYRETIDTVKLTFAEKKSDFSAEALRAMQVSAQAYPGTSGMQAYLGTQAFPEENEGQEGAPVPTVKARRKREKQEKKEKKKRTDGVPAKPENASAKDRDADGKKTAGTRKASRTAKTEPPPPAPEAPAAGDRSEELLQTLSETQRRIFTEMPLDHAVTVDALTRLGFGMGEVMAALTVLEIKGLVQSLPGGLYARM